jgi:hypothetical protein
MRPTVARLHDITGFSKVELERCAFRGPLKARDEPDTDHHQRTTEHLPNPGRMLGV